MLVECQLRVHIYIRIGRLLRHLVVKDAIPSIYCLPTSQIHVHEAINHLFARYLVCQSLVCKVSRKLALILNWLQLYSCRLSEISIHTLDCFPGFSELWTKLAFLVPRI